MRDKPGMDRKKTLRQEEQEQRVLRAAREAMRLLRPGETLGRAERIGDSISFSVQRDSSGTQHRREPQELPGMSSGYTEWFELGVL